MNYCYKILIFFVFVYFNNKDVNAQYSFIAIKDSIILSESNCKIFHKGNLDSSQINEFEGLYTYLLCKELLISYDSISKVINNYSIESRDRMLRIGAFGLKQLKSFESYVFQVYPITYDDSKQRFLIFVLLKEKFPDWDKKPIYMRNGRNIHATWLISP